MRDTRRVEVLLDIERLIKEAMVETSKGQVGIKTLQGLPYALGMLGGLLFIERQEALDTEDKG